MIFQCIKDIALFRQPLLGGFHLLRIKELNLILAFMASGKCRRNSATVKLFGGEIAVGNDSKVITANLREDHTWRQYRFEFFHQRQQQNFSLRLFQHARSITQGFTGDDHQRGGLFTRDNLLQHLHQQGFVRQIRHREAHRIFVLFFIMALQQLLVEVVTAHQHTDFIVLMQTR